ncbi:hypothetical protein BSKO_10309 [Bryopsis sp. KO-2023]|nr:hypothetical protein BSKO_10309 [Bryopsis sp. KO-2023]
MNYLGKVAKGVGGVLKAVEGVAVNRDDAVSAEVEAIVHRILESTLNEDKRAAVGELRDLLQDNPKAQLGIGSKGLSVLCEILFNSREDVEMINGALEVLLAAFSVPENEKDARNQEASAGVINCELFTQKPENLSVVLSLLEDEPIGVNDFYVRYHSVQLLTCLLNTSIFKLQEAILGSPLGVVHLMDLLKEREAIRNEVLLLLAALTRQNGEIQKIAAFEGAFERLFNIIGEEGGCDGGIVVLDCLQLVNNLIRGNPHNQKLFRETGFVSQLLDLLKPFETGSDGFSGGAPLQEHNAGNLKAVLETLTLLASPPSDSSDSTLVECYLTNQEALASFGVLSILPRLALHEGGVSDASVRSGALRCLGFAILGNSKNRMAIQQSQLPVNGAMTGLIQATLQTALSTMDADEYGAADYLLQSFFWNNPQGQVEHLATLQVGLPEPSFGSEVIRALGSCVEGSPVGSRAARVLRYLFEGGNVDIKHRGLATVVQVVGDTRQEYLLNWCMELLTHCLQYGSSWVTSASLLRLLIAWVDVFPPAAQALLEPQHQMSLLVGVLTGGLGQQDQTVVSLTALLLGVCLVATERPGIDGGSGPWEPMRDFIADLISTSIGFQLYFQALEAFPMTPAFSQIANSPGPHSASDTNPLDLEFLQYCHQIVPEIHGYLSNGRRQTPPLEQQHPEAGSAPLGDAGQAARTNSPEVVASEQVSARSEPSPVAGGAPDPTTHLAPTPISVGESGQVPHPSQAFSDGAQLEPHYGNDVTEAGQFGQTAVGRHTPDMYTHPQGMTPVSNGGGAELEELHALRSEVERLRHENANLRFELDKSIAGEKSANVSSSATIAAVEARASQAEAAAASLNTELTDLSRAHRDVQELAARFEQECKAMASQKENAEREYQIAYKQLEDHAAHLGNQVQELETQRQASAPAGHDFSEAIQAAREEAQREAMESTEDLLVCLGLEHEKVNRLSRRLELLGEDVPTVLDGIGQPDGLIFPRRDEVDLT